MDYAFIGRSDLRQGTQTTFDSLQQSSEAHVVSASASLTLGRRVSVRASLPVIYSISEREGVSKSATDLGDLSVALQRYSTPSVFGKPVNLFYGLGVTLPIGSRITDPLANERNFASGTVDPFVNLLGVIGMNSHWSIKGSFFTRQIVGADSDESHPGNLYSGGVGINFHPPATGTIVNAQLRFIKRNQDRVDGELFHSSGGDWTFLDLGVTRNIAGDGEHALQLWTLFCAAGLSICQRIAVDRIMEHSIWRDVWADALRFPWRRTGRGIWALAQYRLGDAAPYPSGRVAKTPVHVMRPRSAGVRSPTERGRMAGTE